MATADGTVYQDGSPVAAFRRNGMVDMAYYHADQRMFPLGKIAKAQALWATYGGHAYYLLGITEDGRQEWRYEGPWRGFLKQSLLPKMTDAVVLSAKGSRGSFSGPDAVQAYEQAAKMVAVPAA